MVANWQIVSTDSKALDFIKLEALETRNIIFQQKNEKYREKTGNTGVKTLKKLKKKKTENYKITPYLFIQKVLYIPNDSGLGGHVISF